MPILDQYGRPYPVQPRKPVDISAAARVQDPGQRWSTPLGHLTPERLFRVLLAAAQGDHEAYLTLAAEMEEKYLHYASQLQTRKLAITGEELEVLPGDDSDQAQEIADAFREHVVEQECFADFLFDLLDGLAKGYSVVQPHWDTKRTPWAPAEYEHLDPRYFVFDRATLAELRLRDDQSGGNGRPLPQGLIVHRPRLRTGVTCRGGIARPASVAYLFQSGTVSQWAVFAETYGMPIRIAYYDPVTSTEDEILSLKTALVNLGHNAAALLPVGQKIEGLDMRRPTSGDNVFKELTTYWDELISKLILGQTMTSDSTGRRGAQAEVHNDVRLDLKRGDARALCGTLRKHLAAPFTLWNYGERAPVPKLNIAVDPPEDLESLSKALAPLVAAGLRVRAQEVRDRFGFAEPEEGDETIEAPAPKVAVGPDGAIPEPKQPPARASRKRSVQRSNKYPYRVR